MNCGVVKISIYLLICLGSGATLLAQDKNLPAQKEKLISDYKNLVNQSQNKVEITTYLNKIAYLYWEGQSYNEAVNYFTQSLEINK
jgi:hypothetical protein